MDGAAPEHQVIVVHTFLGGTSGIDIEIQQIRGYDIERGLKRNTYIVLGVPDIT